MNAYRYKTNAYLHRANADPSERTLTATERPLTGTERTLTNTKRTLTGTERKKEEAVNVKKAPLGGGLALTVLAGHTQTPSFFSPSQWPEYMYPTGPRHQHKPANSPYTCKQPVYLQTVRLPANSPSTYLQHKPTNSPSTCKQPVYLSPAETCKQPVYLQTACLPISSRNLQTA